MSQPLRREPTLALSGSNLSGDVPFSAALWLPGTSGDSDDVHVASSAAGERGDLAVLCHELCERVGFDKQQIAQVLVDVGPGSYTGLRVAVSFARTLAAFAELHVARVCSLAVLANHAWQANGAGARRLRPLLDARRGRYHTASFASAGDAAGLLEQEAAAALPCAQVLDALEPDELVVMARVLFEKIGAEVEARCSVCVVESIEADALLSARMFAFPVRDLAELEPRYLMASYAE